MLLSRFNSLSLAHYLPLLQRNNSVSSTHTTLGRQCAAVRIKVSVRMDPPHKPVSMVSAAFTSKRTIHGNSPLAASEPPTIRICLILIADSPHSAGDTVGGNITHRKLQRSKKTASRNGKKAMSVGVFLDSIYFREPEWKMTRSPFVFNAPLDYILRFLLQLRVKKKIRKQAILCPRDLLQAFGDAVSVTSQA